MVSRMELTSDGIFFRLDIKYVPATTNSEILLPTLFEKTDFILMLESLLPREVIVDVTINDIRMKTNLTVESHIKALNFTNKCFFHSILRFLCCHLRSLGPPSEGFLQKIPETYKFEKKPSTISEMMKFNQNVTASREVS